MRAVVEAGVGGPIKLVSETEAHESPFPDSRVSRLVIEKRPADVSDLRIELWITIEFELGESEVDESTAVARELLDRVVDALAVSAGQEVRIYYWSERVSVQGGQRVRLRPAGIVAQPIADCDPLPLISADLTPLHYRALRHLRHGLAHTSPERRFTSLMLAVMILAQTLPEPPAQTKRCPRCKQPLETVPPGDSARVLNLANILPAWTKDQVRRLWKLRNSVMGHGGRSLTPEVVMELLESSFEAARLAYDCLNASLPNVNLAGPTPSWFMTDLYMLMASGDHAHEGVVDVRVKRQGDEWVATWPVSEPEEFHRSDPWMALRAAQEHALHAMRRPPRPASPEPPEVVRFPIWL